MHLRVSLEGSEPGVIDPRTYQFGYLPDVSQIMKSPLVYEILNRY